MLDVGLEDACDWMPGYWFSVMSMNSFSEITKSECHKGKQKESLKLVLCVYPPDILPSWIPCSRHCSIAGWSGINSHSPVVRDGRQFVFRKVDSANQIQKQSSSAFAGPAPHHMIRPVSGNGAAETACGGSRVPTHRLSVMVTNPFSGNHGEPSKYKNSLALPLRDQLHTT